MSLMDSTWKDLLDHLADLNQEKVESERFQELIEELPKRVDNLVLYSDGLTSKQSLVHYTSWGRGLAILRQKDPVMRMYHYELANDPEEGKILPKSWKAIYEEADDWISSWSSADGSLLSEGTSKSVSSPIEGGDAYGCSFSSNGDGVEDKLTFWRFYGNDGDGCSFKVSRSIFSEYQKIYQVRYRDSNERTAEEGESPEEMEDQNVAAKMRELICKCKEVFEIAEKANKQDACRIVMKAVCKVLVGYRHLIKNIRYADEQEWRMVEVMPARNGVKFDLDHGHLVKRYVRGLPWRKMLSSGSIVTIGPRVRNRSAAMAYVKHLVDNKRKFLGSIVQASRQTYRRSGR